jgi:hypothetical protein
MHPRRCCARGQKHPDAQPARSTTISRPCWPRCAAGSKTRTLGRRLERRSPTCSWSTAVSFSSPPTRRNPSIRWTCQRCPAKSVTRSLVPHGYVAGSGLAEHNYGPAVPRSLSSSTRRKSSPQSLRSPDARVLSQVSRVRRTGACALSPLGRGLAAGPASGTSRWSLPRLPKLLGLDRAVPRQPRPCVQ